MNFTISVPGGTTDHGNLELLCLPAAWTDIVVFLVTNYFAHAASVLPEPGASSRRTIALIFAALILPISGITRAVSATWRHAALETKNPVKRAARSRALAMVMRVPKAGPYRGAVRAVRTWGTPQEADSDVAALGPDTETSSTQELDNALTDAKVPNSSSVESMYVRISAGIALSTFVLINSTQTDRKLVWNTMVGDRLRVRTNTETLQRPWGILAG
jgi:hypothetical protein